MLGSANVDLVFRVNGLPRRGETLMGESFQTFLGGKGANQAVAVGRLGAPVAFVGTVGGDGYGDELVANLERSGVEVSGVDRAGHARTGVGCILVERSGQNRIIVVSGANMLLSADRALAVLERLGPPKVFVTQLEVPMDTVHASLRWAKDHGATTILDPAPATDVPTEMLSLLDYITPNQVELEALTALWAYEPAQCQEAAERLRRRGVKSVVVTLAERGCFWSGPEGHGMIDARTVEAVDTTAAGDAFAGALAYFLAIGEDPVRAIGWANLAGALSTEREGAQDSMPTLAELKAFATRAG